MMSANGATAPSNVPEGLTRCGHTSECTRTSARSRGTDRSTRCRAGRAGRACGDRSGQDVFEGGRRCSSGFSLRAQSLESLNQNKSLTKLVGAAGCMRKHGRQAGHWGQPIRAASAVSNFRSALYDGRWSRPTDRDCNIACAIRSLLRSIIRYFLTTRRTWSGVRWRRAATIATGDA